MKFASFFFTAQQGYNYLTVSYRSCNVFASRGSTGDISCRIVYHENVQQPQVKNMLWFSKDRIKDLRPSYSTEYKFMIITEQPDWEYIDSPGVFLFVTGNLWQHLANTLPSYKQALKTCSSRLHSPRNLLSFPPLPPF